MRPLTPPHTAKPLPNCGTRCLQVGLGRLPRRSAELPSCGSRMRPWPSLLVVIPDTVNPVHRVHGERHPVQTLVTDDTAETSGVVGLPQGLQDLGGKRTRPGSVGCWGRRGQWEAEAHQAEGPCEQSHHMGHTRSRASLGPGSGEMTRGRTG